MPAELFEVLEAGSVRWEGPLKLRQARRKATGIHGPYTRRRGGSSRHSASLNLWYTSTMSHRFRLTVPSDHRVEFELPEEMTGEVEIVVTPVASVRTGGLDLSRKGAIYEALRRSPLVGADLDLTREFEAGREIDL